MRGRIQLQRRETLNQPLFLTSRSFHSGGTSQNCIARLTVASFGHGDELLLERRVDTVASGAGVLGNGCGWGAAAPIVRGVPCVPGGEGCGAGFKLRCGRDSKGRESERVSDRDVG